LNTTQGPKPVKGSVFDEHSLVNFLLKAQKESKPLASGKPRPARSDAFARFVKATQGALMRSMLKKTLGDQQFAEDLVQSTYMKVWKDLPNFDPKKLGPTGVPGWLLRIAINTHISAGRRKRPIVGLEKAGSAADKEWTGFPEPHCPEPSPSDQAHTNFVNAKLAEAVSELPEEKRSIFVMHYLKNMSHKEIAEKTSTTVGSVNMKLFSARRELRGKMELVVNALT